MSKILFVTNQIPYPPDNGVRIVSHYAMRLMREAGHELALAVLTEESDDLAGRFQQISSFCQNGYACWMQLPVRNNVRIQSSALLKNRLFPIERYDCNAFRKKLSELINSFQPDVVHFDIITMAQYRDAVPSGIGTVASINDSYSLTLENLLTTGQYSGTQYIYRRWQLYQTRKYEASAYARFDKVHVMSEVDAAYLKKLNPDIETSVIPNGVNPALFSIADQTLEQSDVIFVAQLVGENLHSLQNFLKTSWPLVIEKCPEAKLYVVGRLSRDAVTVKDIFDSTKGVIFTGYVEHLENIYAKCGIAVVPINKNCGIVNKAIEAMVSGLAVIGFEKTFSGIKEADAGVHYISVSDYHDMGDAVAGLILDKPRCQAIKKAAHALAVDNYSWSSRAEAYENMYQHAAQHARTA
ncbi:glycosyltransferase family 4 protein [Sulfuriferula sp.]|uniref:glycosyltransferase family 4 protein n=1 Tax=Sulfuriferula sp. TaxID=2025307 RepID=UPI00272F2892|nr:glycosyltransferase family 4 protein [Sulfuriferula sp.]MDP2026016.1 glycosyltransferase family 4 protein [Sulfuriferula sp.]